MKESDRRFLEEGEHAGSRYALAAPRRVPLGTAGVRKGSHAGSSLEFKEHREYQPGDDLRHIDWAAYGRSDRLTVKMFHEEVNPHLDLVIDGSRSMALEGSAKASAALGLAAFFASAAANAGYAHAVWVARAECEPVGNGGGLPAAWDAIPFDYRGNPGESLARRPSGWRSRGVRLLLSDLLWESEPLSILAPVAERAAAVVVVQVLAAADVDPPESGNLRLVDVETDRVRQLYVDAAARERYRAALARHQQNWNDACRQVGGVFTTVVAEEVIRHWRLDVLVAAEVLKVI
jgi:uncharacterized protein (DUF58 family)